MDYKLLMLVVTTIFTLSSNLPTTTCHEKKHSASPVSSDVASSPTMAPSGSHGDSASSPDAAYSPSMSPSGLFEDPTQYAPDEIFVCSKYDPSLTLERASKDPSIKELCATTDHPKKCLDFLGNTPDANPAYIMKEDLKTLQTLIDEGSAIASKAESPDLKKSYETCAENYEKASKSVGDAQNACEDCDNYKKKMDKKNKKDEDKKDKEDTKCPKNKVTKITSKLSAAVSSFGFCDEALDGASGGANTWVLKDMNGAMIEATNMLLEVSKQLE
ncbi:hypothetical protein LINPERHAP1_LOCUS34785 [Linum perenne]